MFAHPPSICLLESGRSSHKHWSSVKPVAGKSQYNLTNRWQELHRHVHLQLHVSTCFVVCCLLNSFKFCLFRCLFAAQWCYAWLHSAVLEICVTCLLSQFDRAMKLHFVYPCCVVVVVVIHSTQFHYVIHSAAVINTLRTGDADLRFYITIVQDGWRKSAFLTRACFPCAIDLIMQYIEPLSEWFCWRIFIETWPHSELTFRHRASSI